MKKLTRKEKIAMQQQSQGKQISQKQLKDISRSEYSLKRILILITGIIAFVVYSNTLNHQYVLDDFGLIPDNLLTKKGISAWPEIFSSTYRAGTNMIDNSLYRPLSKAMFALEWQIAPDSPSLGHWINVLFFSFTCMLIFSVIALCLKGNLLIPLLCAVFFATHPIHTEVVANIKSRDEIMCLFFSLLAAWSCLQYGMNKGKIHLLSCAVFFFLALLSKESAVMLFFVILLMLHFFIPAENKWKWRSAIPLAFVTVFFLAIRSNIVTSGSDSVLIVDNHLVGISDFITREINAIYILGVYIKQLIFPIQMIADGSYNHFKYVNAGNIYFILTLLAFLAMGIYALIRFSKKDLFSFSILYFLITLSLVSNVFFLIGTNYGERLLYIPSLGFCLALAGIIAKVFSSNSDIPKNISAFFGAYKTPLLASTVLLVFYSVNTYARNKDWYDDGVLYRADILKVPESAHMRFYYANHISSDDEIEVLKDSIAIRKTYDEALEHLNRAIEIFPRYADAYQRIGFILHKLKMNEEAEKNYLKSIELNPNYPVAQNNYANLLFESRRFDEALKYFSAAFRLNPHYSHAASNIASVYGVYGEGLKHQSELDPANREELLSESMKNFKLSVQYFETAIRLDPEAISAYRMLAVTYRHLGDEQNASKYSALADRKQREKK